MKNKLHIFILVIFSSLVFGKAKGQNPIPNPDFETWQTDTFFTSSYFLYDHPTGWDAFISGFYWGFGSGNGPLSCYKSTSKYSGAYALNLTVENDSAGADMMTFFPINYRPLQLNGYYKMTAVPGDTSFVIVGITKGDPISWAFGDTSLEVGTGSLGLTGTSVTTYQPFSIPITYKDLTTFPDSAMIVITATNNIGTSKPGQKLWVDNLYFSGASAVEEELSDKNIRVYPNPVKDYLSIDVWGNFPIDNDLEVLDLLGKNVFSEKLGTNFSKVNLSALKNGMYILRVTNEEGIFTKKIIKN